MKLDRDEVVSELRMVFEHLPPISKLPQNVKSLDEVLVMDVRHAYTSFGGKTWQSVLQTVTETTWFDLMLEPKDTVRVLPALLIDALQNDMNDIDIALIYIGAESAAQYCHLLNQRQKQAILNFINCLQIGQISTQSNVIDVRDWWEAILQ
jgi:hypothetical protein